MPLEAIGRTPLVRLKTLPGPDCEALRRVAVHAEQDGWFWTRQFENPDNRAAYHAMAAEAALVITRVSSTQGLSDVPVGVVTVSLERVHRGGSVALD